MSDEVVVVVSEQGDAICGKSGYMLIKSENIVAFYLDGWGETSRIYPLTTCSNTIVNGNFLNYPSITIADGAEESTFTDIYFPEYEGWNVHAVSGGKTMSVCLTKRK